MNCNIIKKALCAFISMFLVMVFLIPLRPTITEEINKHRVLSSSEELVEIVKKYDDVNNKKDKNIYTRLIVKHNRPIKSSNAVDIVHCINYSILQYDDVDSARKDKAAFEKQGYLTEYDSVLTLNSIDNWAYEETSAISTVDYYKSRIKSTVNVAVIDTGINYNHEIFSGRINRTYMDFSAENDNNEIDTVGHGTNVASVIANCTPSNVKISMYKVFDKNRYGTSSMLLAAFEYIQQLSTKPDIINCSLVANGSGSGILPIFEELIDDGITIVAGAGNDSGELKSELTIEERVITVGAINSNGKVASFSNYGANVDISAPGVNVLVADMGGGYEYCNGTSISTPFVSAACAVTIMEHKSYTPEQIEKEIKDNAIPFNRSSGYIGKYGVGVLNFSNLINGTRCKTVTADIQSGLYRDDINVELSCANSLVDIYYTLDGTLPTKTNGLKYSAPFVIDQTTRVNAVAYAKVGTPFYSKYSTFDYYIFKNNESEFKITKEGYVYNYLGNEKNLVIPEIINGIVPKEIDERCFYLSDVESITLPKSIERINDYAFFNCTKLNSINLENISYIGMKAFYNCSSLINGDFSSLEYIDSYGLANTCFETINAPNCWSVSDFGLSNCKSKELVFRNLTNIGIMVFNECENIKLFYAPKAKSVNGITSDNIFLPTVTNLSIALNENTTVYCANNFDCYVYNPNKYNFKLVAPKSSCVIYKDNIVDSDNLINFEGNSIRSNDNGLKFSFTFDEENIAFDFKKIAEKIEYGFVYNYAKYDDNVDINESLRAGKRFVFTEITNNMSINDGVVSFNAVFTDINENCFDDIINLRAYMCVDDMYFYSPVISTCYNNVSNVSQQENTDTSIKSILGHEHIYDIKTELPTCAAFGYTSYNCSLCFDSFQNDYRKPLGHNYVYNEYKFKSYYYRCNYCNGNAVRTKNNLPSFDQYINTNVNRGNDNAFLDVVTDGIINAKDYAKINRL